MSDVEFVGRINPKPFKSFAKIEQERIELIKQAQLKAAGNVPPEPEPEITRERFPDEGGDW